MREYRCPCCDQPVEKEFLDKLREVTEDREKELASRMAGSMPPPYRGTLGFNEEIDPQTGRKLIYATRNIQAQEG